MRLYKKLECVIRGLEEFSKKTKMFIFNMLKNIYNNCDTARPWGLYFQDSATPQMEGLVELHDNIMFYLVIILFAVG